MDTTDYSFILDNIRFSYSSVSTFSTCPYAFKLTYIDALSREPNFYAEYGTLVHTCFEKYFTGEVDYYDLPQYFTDNFDAVVITPAPDFPPGMREKYQEAGVKFFSELSFNKDDFEIINVESKLDFSLAEGIVFTARPDLVLKNKETQKTALYDYKSSSVFKTNRYGVETRDDKKISDYYRQMFLYTYALRVTKGIKIDEITLWFTRPDKQVTIPWTQEREDAAVHWALKEIRKIKTATDYPYDNSSQYFCQNLCGVRSHCIYK